LKVGTLIRGFKAKDGRDVILRAPRWTDLDDMLDFINSLVEEGAEINVDTKKTRDEEVDWLARLLSSVEKGRQVAIVAEVDGRWRRSTAGSSARWRWARGEAVRSTWAT